MEIQLLQKRTGKFHIADTRAQCLAASEIIRGALTRFRKCLFSVDEPDSLYAFLLPSGDYIDQSDVCQTCKRSLVAALKRESPQ